MKPAVLIAAALLMTATATSQEASYFSGYASHQQANLDQAVTRYLGCLGSENEGVVESGLAHLGRMKLYYLDRPFPEAEQALTALLTTGRTPEIRYRAYLVETLFASPSAFRTEASAEYRTPDELFTAIAARLQQTMLGSVASGK